MKLFKERTDTPKKPDETPKQMVSRVAAELEAARLRDRYELDRQEIHAQLAIKATEVQEAKTAVKSRQTSKRRSMVWNKVIDYSPLVTISVLAIIGQYGYLSTALEPKFPGIVYVVAALAAAATESITLFLGYHAMLALRRRDSAAGLIAASIVVGSIVAFMNYSHFTGTTANPEDLTPNATAVIFGMFSFTNPFLWRTKIRSDYRNELAANGEIEPRGVKLGRSRWLLHTVRTFRVTRAASWIGERNPEKAIALWEERQRTIADGHTVDQRDAMICALQTEISTLRAELSDTKIERVSSDNRTDMIAQLDSMVFDLRMEIAALHAGISDVQVERVPEDETPKEKEKEKTPERRELPPAKPYRFLDHPKWNDGIALFSASVDGGQPMKQEELAVALGQKSRLLASEIMRYVREGQVNVRGDSTTVGTQAP